MPDAPPRWRFWVAGTLQAVLAIAVIVAAMVIYEWLYATAPDASRSARPRTARLVEVVPAQAAQTGPVIEAWGEVVPARSLSLRPEITGRVTGVHPELTEGGRLPAGAAAVTLDDRDMALAKMQVEAEIAEIDARIRIERGQGAIGQRELTRLSNNLTDEQRSLVLREPQMLQLEAEKQAATARLDLAELDLTRTRVSVPFDALVLSETVAEGSSITAGTEIATLVAADRFHVKLSLPPADLPWVSAAREAPVRITHEGVWPQGTEREGWITRLSSSLTELGRLAEVIVEVDDPLGDGARGSGGAPLLLGSFVRAEITAPVIEGTVLLDRAHLRDGDTVWVMDADDTLAIRTVEIVWRGTDTVLVRGGVAPGDRIVTTQLATFATGMALRLRDAEPGKGDGA